MRASSTLSPGSRSLSPNAGRGLRRRVLLGGVVAVGAAVLVAGVLVQPAAPSAGAPTPTGPGSVSGAPNLPPGFTTTFTSRYVDANGLRMHAVIGGQGPPLLLIHGWPQTWYAWRLVMPALARDFRVIAVDQRGIGLTDKPTGGYDTASQADDMVALMAALGHRRFAVYGTDTGMPIAYALAADHPERVQRLVVAEASLAGVAPAPPLFLPPLLNARLWHLMFNQLPAEVNERLVKGREAVFFGSEFAVWAARPLPEGAVRYYIDILRSDRHALGGSFGWYRALDATIAQEAQRATRRLTLPVLAIGGQFGAGATVAATMRMVADDVQGVVIGGSGHWVAEEAPAELLAALTAFLAPDPDPAAAARP
jgi:pimeloyl-ACP methyl ester carboxylesterase